MQILFGSEVERKIFHLSSLWIAAFIYLFPAEFNAILFFSLSVVGIIAEIGYHRRWPVIYPLYNGLFGHILRSRERGKAFHLSGGVYLLIAAFIAAFFFNREVGTIALCVMLISDTCAGLVGRKFGKFKLFEKKTLAGTAAFVVSGLLVVFVLGYAFDFELYRYFIGSAAVLVAALAELYESKIKIDDNLAVVLIVGFILSF